MINPRYEYLKSNANLTPDEEQRLESIFLASKNQLLTGSREYGEFYQTNKSDYDVLIYMDRDKVEDLFSKSAIIDAQVKRGSNRYRLMTHRERLGNVDCIVTWDYNTFYNWVGLHNYLKTHPVPTKADVITMFDLMENNEDYAAWWEDNFGWIRHNGVDYTKCIGSYLGDRKIIGLERTNIGNCFLVLEKCGLDTGLTSGSTIFGNLFFGENYSFELFSEVVNITKSPLGEETILTSPPDQLEQVINKDENMSEDSNYKDALKRSGNKMKGHIKHGMAVGAATEGANFAYEQVANVLKTQFGVSDESLNDPLKRELITFAALAVAHMGATVFDEVPGMDKVTKGCELALEGKAKDNTGALIQNLLPMLMNVSRAMDPEVQMQRIMEEAERKRVETIDIEADDAEAELTAALEQTNEPRKVKAKAKPG